MGATTTLAAMTWRCARHRRTRASMQATLLDEIDVSMIVTGSDLTVLSWSAGAERLYGWTAGEAIGRSARETILPKEENLAGRGRVQAGAGAEWAMGRRIHGPA
jgi:PAS domain S-box-containing protein